MHIGSCVGGPRDGDVGVIYDQDEMPQYAPMPEHKRDDPSPPEPQQIGSYIWSADDGVWVWSAGNEGG